MAILSALAFSAARAVCASSATALNKPVAAAPPSTAAEPTLPSRVVTLPATPFTDATVAILLVSTENA